MTLGFVGLGVMGGRMAKRLLDGGHRVIGYKRTRASGPAVGNGGGAGVAKSRKIGITQGLAVPMIPSPAVVLLGEKSGIARELAVKALLDSVLDSRMLKYRGRFVLRVPAEAWWDV